MRVGVRVAAALVGAAVCVLPTLPAAAATGPVANPCERNGSCDDSATWLVRPGQTLWGIAVAHFGDGTRWREIAKLNHVTDPRALRAGTVLRMR